MTTASVLNRRDFLKTGASAGAALVVGFHLSPAALAAALRSLMRSFRPGPAPPSRGGLRQRQGRH